MDERSPPEDSSGGTERGRFAGCFPRAKGKKPHYGQVQADGEMASALEGKPGQKKNFVRDWLHVSRGGRRGSDRDDEPLLFALTWAQPQRYGTPPSPRNGHTMTLIGMHVYIFGGGDENLSFNDVHTLHVGNMTWDKPILHGTMPSPRSRHSATTLGNNMVVFGGVGGGNDLHILEVPRAGTNLRAPARARIHVDARGRRTL